jgi:hypothetical protein
MHDAAHQVLNQCSESTMESFMRADLETHGAFEVRNFAEQFNAAFAKVRVNPGEYTPELTMPEGPSTAGGKRAMQRLRLISKWGFPAVLAGSVNLASRTAEVRTFEQLRATHRERFQKPLEMSQAEYESFFDMAKSYFETTGLKVTVRAPSDPPPAEGGNKMRIGFVLGLIFIACVALAFWAVMATH